jgi:hypothetical protein
LVDAAAGVAPGVAGGVAIAVAGDVASGVAGGVEIGVAGAVAIGVAGGVAIAVAGGVSSGVAAGVEIGFVEGVVVEGGVVIGRAGGAAAAGTENNSKSLTRIGIDETEDSVACGHAKLGKIPKAEVRTKKLNIRMVQANFPNPADEKNMTDSLGQVRLQHTRCSGRQRMKSYCIPLLLLGAWRVSMTTPESKTPGRSYA